MTAKRQPHILVVSPERIGDSMAGPAIRALELARQLTTVGQVTISAPKGSVAEDKTLKLAEVWPITTALAVRFDVVVTQEALPIDYAKLHHAGTRVVMDMYIPSPLEAMEQFGPESPQHQLAQLGTLEKLLAADLVLCASEKQRDLWLGSWLAEEQIRPTDYQIDPTFRSKIAVIPFGLPRAKPRHTKQVLKGVWPGIRADDRVVLWGGGVWEWLDAITVIRAVGGLPKNVKLFFMGLGRPATGDSTGQTAMPAADEAISYAKRRGLYGTQVVFNEGWVDYRQRHNYLLEADIGVSAHFDHLETRFAFRTRMLDYLWAGLPIVATEGDAFAELIERRGLGRAVPYQNPSAYRDALRAQLQASTRRATKGRIEKIRSELTWANAAKPLVTYCNELPAVRTKDLAALKAISSKRRALGRQQRLADLSPGQVIARAARKALRGGRS